MNIIKDPMELVLSWEEEERDNECFGLGLPLA
jgi:hypothetical protein